MRTYSIGYTSHVTYYYSCMVYGRYLIKSVLYKCSPIKSLILGKVDGNINTNLLAGII